MVIQMAALPLPPNMHGGAVPDFVEEQEAVDVDGHPMPEHAVKIAAGALGGQIDTTAKVRQNAYKAMKLRPFTKIGHFLTWVTSFITILTVAFPEIIFFMLPQAVKNQCGRFFYFAPGTTVVSLANNPNGYQIAHGIRNELGRHIFNGKNNTPGYICTKFKEVLNFVLKGPALKILKAASSSTNYVVKFIALLHTKMGNGAAKVDLATDALRNMKLSKGKNIEDLNNDINELVETIQTYSPNVVPDQRKKEAFTFALLGNPYYHEVAPNENLIYDAATDLDTLVLNLQRRTDNRLKNKNNDIKFGKHAIDKSLIVNLGLAKDAFEYGFDISPEHALELAHEECNIESNAQMASNAQVRSETPCEYFAENRCKAGNNCPWLHSNAKKIQGSRNRKQRLYYGNKKLCSYCKKMHGGEICFKKRREEEQEKMIERCVEKTVLALGGEYSASQANIEQGC